MTMAGPTVELDGRTLEGGGQLLRIALCLSALTFTPIHITHIRGNRSGGGGLKAQHLTCVKWLARACNATVTGAEKGSSELGFRPGEGDPGGSLGVWRKVTMADGRKVWEARCEVGSAGSTGLVCQAVLPFVLFTQDLPWLKDGQEEAPVLLRFSGGTNVSASPSFDYIQHVLLRTLRFIGCGELTATLGKRGWSQGGSMIGHWSLLIERRPRLPLPAFKLCKEDYGPGVAGAIEKLTAVLVAPRQCHNTARNKLEEALAAIFPNEKIDPDILVEDSGHPKRLYLLVAIEGLDWLDQSFIGRDWLYDRKIHDSDAALSEMIEKVVSDLRADYESATWVDEHLRDQIVIFQALAKGRTEAFPGFMSAERNVRREPSLHARTAEWVCRQVLGPAVRFDGDGTCEGMGFGEPAEEETLETKTNKLDLSRDRDGARADDSERVIM